MPVCCGVLLLAIPSGVVPHCRSRLLVWCLTIGQACWRGTSLYALPAGPFALQLTFCLTQCRRKTGGYKSGATLTEVPLH